MRILFMPKVITEEMEAMMIEGFPVEDPVAFCNQVCQLMEE